MNINHLWYFINVAQTRSIRKTADFCKTSPSTITSALKKLSDETLVPLYNKTAFGIELTEEGRVLYTAAQSVIAKLEQCNIYYMSQHLHISGSLKFAALPGIMAYILSPIFSTMMSFYTDLTASFNTYDTEQLLLQVDQMQEDIGYLNFVEEDFSYYSELYPNLIFQKYVTCRSVFLTNKNHPLSEKVTVSSSALSQYPIVAYVHNNISDNPLMRKHFFKNIQFTHNENYSAEVIKESYNYLALIPYLNGKIPDEFYDINSQILLFPQNDLTYYVTCVYHKNSPKKMLIQDYLIFADQFYGSTSVRGRNRADYGL